MREATRGDTAELWRVRYAVRENTLPFGRIPDIELHEQIEVTGRGWVIEKPGEPASAQAPTLMGFAIANARNGNIWALFVDPEHAGQGHGRRLHDTMLAWMWAQGLNKVWLTTTPGTRAEAFYRRAGWQSMGKTHDAEEAELRFEMARPTDVGQHLARHPAA
ncbi:GNAT family N-acetyltransferase [Roseateles koreensis]|uniref:GNAT family N-acetyltransferase n=1 Tax=Roseateles koreensis TaxID=2987526 RepID=A0ABT5KNW6_9BURK|nr:GNAT family N-acetyltransferase [Roseateles koreensis]MDC8784058.1 GNAT family N-acetyltransferase [Roseateles koreensis]